MIVMSVKTLPVIAWTAIPGSDIKSTLTLRTRDKRFTIFTQRNRLILSTTGPHLTSLRVQ